MAVRSLREIHFRLRQEAANLAMFVSPPAIPPGAAAPTLLPDPIETAARLRGSAFARQVEALARRILEHRFPLLGIEIETGPQIDWRRDYLHGISSGLPYFRRSPYLDFARVGDHKLVWELNRHQHLVLLAQAFRFTGERAFLDEAFRQLESWLDANPFLRGINWASALEVAFRALSWIWLGLLAGGLMPEPLARRFHTALFRHGCFLQHNLSVYFSPNTHLLGEAVALHALGALFPAWPRAARWAGTGGRIVQEEIERQVRPDGSHFEQSAYYHVYALDFFLLHRTLAQTPEPYNTSLYHMAEYLHALMGPSGLLPYLGDDDGGRVFHPYGERARFGLGTMATCAALFDKPQWLRDPEDLDCQAGWWLPPREEPWRRHSCLPGPEGTPDSSGRLSPAATGFLSHSHMFPDAGVAVMISGTRQVIVKAGPFGEGSGGHSHSDILSLVARLDGREILIDPGTYTYIADPAERDEFRGSAAHNTVRINASDQAIPAGPFRWNAKPITAIREWTTGPESDSLDASCSYNGFTHRRRVRFLKPAFVIVLDTVEGPAAGEHYLEQFWHLGSPEDRARLSFSMPADLIEGWRSRAFGAKEPAPVLRVTCLTQLPAQIAAVLDLSDTPARGRVTLKTEAGKTVVSWPRGQAEF